MMGRLKGGEKSADATKWTTTDEVNWMKGLGDHRPVQRGAAHLPLLKRYRKTLDKRERWGEVDSERVKEVCDELIRGWR